MINTNISYIESEDIGVVETHKQLIEEIKKKSVENAETVLAGKIGEYFKSGQAHRWPPVTYKKKPRSRILIETGELLSNTNQLIIDLVNQRQDFSVDDKLDIGDILNYYSSSPYIMTHEQGDQSRNIPERSFLKQAIEDAINTYIDTHNYVVGKIEDIEHISSNKVLIQDDKVLGQTGQMMNRMRMISLMRQRDEPDKSLLKGLFNVYPIWTVLIPPNMGWKLLGQALDIKGMIENKVNMQLIEAFMIAFFAAKFGTTGKQQKRRLRQQIWY